MHGLPRAVCQGFIAGREAVTENAPARRGFIGSQKRRR
jgi:hypothetical protein